MCIKEEAFKMDEVLKILDETIEMVRQTYTGFKRFNDVIDNKVHNLLIYVNSLSIKKYDMTFAQIDDAYTYMTESMEDISDELERHRKIATAVILCDTWIEIMEVDESYHRAFIEADNDKEYDLKSFESLLGRNINTDCTVTKRDILAYIKLRGL